MKGCFKFLLLCFVIFMFFCALGIYHVAQLFGISITTQSRELPVQASPVQTAPTNRPIYDPNADTSAPAPENPTPVETREKPVAPTVEASVLNNDLATVDLLAARMLAACDYQKARPFVLPVLRSKDINVPLIAQVCDIYDFMYANWQYVEDPLGEEYVGNASVIWNGSLKGDCDDWTVATASALRLIGADVHFVIAKGPAGRHAYAEMVIDKADRYAVRQYLQHRYFRNDRKPEIYFCDYPGLNKTYINLDYQVPHPGGRYFKADNTLVVDLLTQTYRRYNFSE